MNKVFPGSIRQNAYVVDDLHAAMEGWLATGIGPWLVLRSFAQTGSEFRGAETSPVVSIAFANSGELQLELIVQEDESPSVYKEFTSRGRTGFHHVAFWSEEFETTLSRAEQAGWPVVQSGSTGGVAKFAYLDAGGFTSPYVEVMELNEMTRWLASEVRRAANEWDGRDPVRNLG